MDKSRNKFTSINLTFAHQSSKSVRLQTYIDVKVKGLQHMYNVMSIVIHLIHSIADNAAGITKNTFQLTLIITALFKHNSNLLVCMQKNENQSITKELLYV